MHHSLLVVIRNATDPIDASNKLDDLIQPYNENLEVSPYVEWCSDAEVARAEAAFRDDPSEYGPGPLSKVPEGDLEAFNEWRRRAVGAWHTGTESGVYNPETGKFGHESTCNPEGRWDWWQLGGRWHGFWQVRPGVLIGAEPAPLWKTPIGNAVEAGAGLPVASPGHQAVLGLSGTGGDDPDENFQGRADLACKGDIDFEAMRTLAAQTADRSYDRYEEIARGLVPGPSMRELRRKYYTEVGLPASFNFRESWGDAELSAKWNEAGKKASEDYRAQEWVQALHANDLVGLFMDTHEYWLGGREAFIERARQGVVSTASTLVDGQWREQGWGDDEIPRHTWLAQTNRIIDNLSDDCFLAIVDYHS